MTARRGFPTPGAGPPAKALGRGFSGRPRPGLRRCLTCPARRLHSAVRPLSAGTAGARRPARGAARRPTGSGEGIGMKIGIIGTGPEATGRVRGGDARDQGGTNCRSSCSSAARRPTAGRAGAGRDASCREGRRRCASSYVDIDCLRPDHLGCYGYPRATSPELDRLVAEGARVRRGDAAGRAVSPLCDGGVRGRENPPRAGLGQYPRRRGPGGVPDGVLRLRPPEADGRARHPRRRAHPQDDPAAMMRVLAREVAYLRRVVAEVEAER